MNDSCCFIDSLDRISLRVAPFWFSNVAEWLTAWPRISGWWYAADVINQFYAEIKYFHTWLNQVTLTCNTHSYAKIKLVYDIVPWSIKFWCKEMDFFCAYHPTIPGSNPKHTIYDFIAKFCTIYVIVLSKEIVRVEHLQFNSNAERNWK